jgi:hypothetical protein
VLVWFALMLVMLIGFAGFAVDLSNWWLQAERLQRAADAGAHAGVVFLPADMTSATTTVRSEVAKNGYRTNGAGADATAEITQEPNPNRLRVRLTTTVPSYFVQLLGVDEVTLTREAVAEYIAPVPMGSPENKLGNDPARGDVAAQFWINIAGPNGNKFSGDRYQSKNCPTRVAGCSATAIPGIQNDDYSMDGYFFALKVASPVSGQPLNVQVYDPGMIYVGDSCTNATFPSAAQLTTLAAWYPDAAQRYAGGLTSWCTGDQDIGGRTTQTTFVVREPDDTPWTYTDNPVVNSCTTTMPAYNPTGSNPTIFQYLNPTDGVQDAQAVRDGVAPWTFAEVFRQNVTICSIPAASVVQGEYVLQIRSNVTAADPLNYSAAVNQGGHNRMSIQAGFGTTGVAALDGSAVSINALGRLPIYANANSASTNFYLARVLPYDAGRTLRINLFDISDVGDSGTLRIVPPAEIGGTFSECGFSNDDTSKSMTFNTGTCTLTVPNGYYNERVVTVDVPIPDDYDCNPSVGTECWITVRAEFNGPVNDTTTWSAAILGNPVRLVE